MKTQWWTKKQLTWWKKHPKELKELNKAYRKTIKEKRQWFEFKGCIVLTIQAKFLLNSLLK